MKGALVGSLALIALYTVTQQAAADRVTGLAGAVVTFARRLLSPTVAGLPDFSTRPKGSKSPYDPASTTNVFGLTENTAHE